MTTQKYPLKSIVVYIGRTHDGATRGFPGRVMSYSPETDSYLVSGPFNRQSLTYDGKHLLTIEEYKADNSYREAVCKELAKGHTLRYQYGFRYLLNTDVVIENFDSVMKVYDQAFEINCIFWEYGESAAAEKGREFQTTQFATLTEALETMYSGLYDLDVNKGQLIIHYPKVDITNSRNEKITIYDLYVRFEIPSMGNLRTPQGVTATRTHKQFASSYSHSHLSTGTSTGFSQFCIGDGTPIRNFVNKFQRQPAFCTTTEEFLMFFATLDAYVHWESLEGGPYIKINQVVGGDARIPNVIPAEVTITYNKMLDELKELPLQVINNSQFALSQTPELEAVLDKVSTQKVIKLDNGTILNPVTTGSKEVPDKVLAARMFTFKGKDVQAIITNKVGESAEPANSTLVTLPALKSAVYNKLNQLINPNFYLEEQIKQIDK